MACRVQLPAELIHEADALQARTPMGGEGEQPPVSSPAFLGKGHSFLYYHPARGVATLHLHVLPVACPQGAVLRLVAFESGGRHCGHRSDIHGCWVVSDDNTLFVAWNCLGTMGTSNYFTEWCQDKYAPAIWVEKSRFRYDKRGKWAGPVMYHLFSWTSHQAHLAFAQLPGWSGAMPRALPASALAPAAGTAAELDREWVVC